MSTQGVNGANISNLSAAQLEAKLKQAFDKKDWNQVQIFSKALEEKKNAGTEVEHNDKAQPQTAEQAEAKAVANKKANDEIAQMKAKAEELQKQTTAKAEEKYVTNTNILREGTKALDTKEEVQAEFGDLKKRTARKIAKAADNVNGRLDTFDAVEHIYTDKAEYKKAVEQAKADGTWNKDNPKYTLLDGKELEGAKKMQQEAQAKVDDALKQYNTFKEIYENPKTEADKQKAFQEMVNAAKQLNSNYNASKMFNEDGSINKDGYQKAMLQFSGADFKANLDERKALKENAGLKRKRQTKEMFRAAGLDIEKDYTWAMKAGTLALGVGTGALTGLLGGGAVAQAVASATATATSTATATATADGTYYHEFQGPDGSIHAIQGGEVVTESATATSTETAKDVQTAVAKISKGKQALRGALGALPAALLSAAFVKDKGGKDAFNGLTAEEILKNAGQVKGKANKALVQQIIDLPNITTTQKAAILHAAYGDNTGKKVNTEELVAAYTAAKYLNSHPELVNPEKADKPAGDTPPVETQPVETPPVVTPPVKDTVPNILKTKDQEKDVQIQHRTGMGPWQYGEALGIPRKHMREFINQFRQDNSMDTGGHKFNKTPIIQKTYTFADGTTVDVAKDKKEAQDKVNNYNLGKVDPFNGKQTSVNGRDVIKIGGQWVYKETRQPVSQEDYNKYVKPYLDENGNIKPPKPEHLEKE